MVSRIILCTTILLLHCAVWAQEDSVLLSELTVSGHHFQRFSSGSVSALDLSGSDANLEDVLSRENSIYFKNYGNKQLSTIAFRGTSSSHTNVLWHGIPSNYPTLGQMDFSQWPSWFMESVDLAPGSNGALYGSGAIGGSVLIDSDISKKRPYAQMQVGIGSYGYNFVGARGAYKLAKLTGETRLYHSSIENDFTYNHNGQVLTQQNAASQDYGAQQKLWLDLGGGMSVFFDGQYTFNDREIQPPRSSPSVNDLLETENVRVAAGFQKEAANSSLSSTLAYLKNDQFYNNSIRTISNQYSLLLTYWIELRNHIEIRYGGNINAFTASSNNYPEMFTDWRSSFFASIKMRPNKWWVSTFNARQSFYQGRFPFTPTWGNEFLLGQSSDSRLVLVQQVAFGFRYPTLNDRYWQPGGSPNLRPESSFQAELGLKRELTKSEYKSESAINLYRTWSENWIVWLPNGEGIWSPTNFRSVIVNGLELSQGFKFSLFNLSNEFKVNYSLTQSLNQTGANAGNLLPYTPLNNAGFLLGSGLQNGLSVNVLGDFTDRRYTTLDNVLLQSVDPFFLLDLKLSQRIAWSGYTLVITGAVLNLLDNDYENLINRAMPGRNYQLNLSIKFN